MFRLHNIKNELHYIRQHIYMLLYIIHIIIVDVVLCYFVTVSTQPGLLVFLIWNAYFIMVYFAYISYIKMVY